MTITLTLNQWRALHEAAGQMVDGNGRDFDNWKEQTCGTRAEWNSLVRAYDTVGNALHLRGAA